MMNDDDDSTFRPLAIAVASVLSKIEEFKETGGKAEQPDRDKRPGNEQQSRDKAKGEHRSYVERRLRDLAEFERRAAIGKRLKR